MEIISGEFIELALNYTLTALSPEQGGCFVVVGGEESEDYTGDGAGHVEDSTNQIPEWLQ